MGSPRNLLPLEGRFSASSPQETYSFFVMGLRLVSPWMTNPASSPPMTWSIKPYCLDSNGDIYRSLSVSSSTCQVNLLQAAVHIVPPASWATAYSSWVTACSYSLWIHWCKSLYVKQLAQDSTLPAIELKPPRSCSICSQKDKDGVLLWSSGMQQNPYLELISEGLRLESLKFTFSIGCPVYSDIILLRLALWYMISLAWISISTAWPLAPPRGWWIMIRAFGILDLLPLAPAPRMKAPMEAASPKQQVWTSALHIYKSKRQVRKFLVTIIWCFHVQAVEQGGHGALAA